MAHTQTGRPGGETLKQLGIRFEGLSKSFGKLQAVRAIDLDIPPGKIFSLLGPSGCGKTTALRMLAGLERADAGSIWIGDRQVEGSTFIPAHQRRIGMVFQDYALFPHMTAAENIRFALPKEERKLSKRVHELMALVGLTGSQNSLPQELSGGQQQRVALARALAMRPDIVLLDEPFSNLDAKLRTRVRNDVCRILRETGITTVLVTHDQEEALSLSDTVSVMFKGEIIQTADPETLYQRPCDRKVATFLGDANFLYGEATGGKIESELGNLEASNGAEGSVLCMIRPESIHLEPCADGVGRVVETEYFGHDLLVHVRMPSGTNIQSRLLGPCDPLQENQPVSVEVRHPVVTFQSI